MHSASKPWQQATALVSLGLGGAITGFSFVPKAAAEATSPASMPIHLEALARPAQPAPAGDAPLRSAIVNIADHFLRMAGGRTPAEMQAIIWQHDSVGGVDHGESCAAFASLTLELAAHTVGQQSWVTGGTSYPWPLHKWADVRVDPNPASPDVVSVLQDAEAHHRWHPLGDGYQPQPGDWVLFDNHVEVVTRYTSAALSTIGGDSLPNFSVNAHRYSGPLTAQGVVGFVNNGDLSAAAGGAPAAAGQLTSGYQGPGQAQSELVAIPGVSATGAPAPAPTGSSGGTAIPGMPNFAAGGGRNKQSAPRRTRRARPAAAGAARSAGRSAQGGGAAAAAGVPGAGIGWPAGAPQTAEPAAAAIPGVPVVTAHRLAGSPQASPTAPYSRHRPSQVSAPAADTGAEQAFIHEVAPGAVAMQQRYGVPASVTIAQAIDESGWGRSSLAVNDHNLFGIKGTGPAGSDTEPTQEDVNGQWVQQSAPFRVYDNAGQSIEDHGKLLATSGYYRHAMADRRDPNAFAQALTGVYATDPNYGTKIIGLMRRYNLYRYDVVAAASSPAAAAPAAAGAGGSPAIPGLPPYGAASAAATAPAAGARAGGRATRPAHTPAPAATGPAPAGAGPATAPPSPPGAAPVPSATPVQSSPPARTAGPGRSAAPARSGRPGQGAAPRPTAGPTGGAAPARTARPVRSARRAPAAPTAPRSTAPRSTAPRSTTPAGASAAPIPAAPPAPPPAPTATAPPPPPSAPPATSAPAGGAPASSGPAPTGSARPSAARQTAGTTAAQRPSPAPGASTAAASATVLAAAVGGPSRRPPKSRTGRTRSSMYSQPIPPQVRKAFTQQARVPLMREEPLYRDVAGLTGIRWELLAACDWLQCEARPRYSPVHGEKLGTLNPDGTIYRTKSEALAQCAEELVTLARAVYDVDPTARGNLSVRELANVFAAFRWGGLLKLHRTSAMEFPYSVAGLTTEHLKMRWPKIPEPHAPDKPGSRFRKPFGAVPIVLSLSYPATV